jgi:GNAT superfamily N-acetyltransferase
MQSLIRKVLAAICEGVRQQEAVMLSRILPRRWRLALVVPEGGSIRKLWSVERDAYRDHLLRLDAESRYNRFCGTIADNTIRNCAATARGSDVMLHGFFVDDVLRGAADLRILGHETEAALSIEKPWQSHGIGSALLERSLLAAWNRGIKLVRFYCLAGNQRMEHLARKFDAEITFDFGMMIGKMENPHPVAVAKRICGATDWVDPARVY